MANDNIVNNYCSSIVQIATDTVSCVNEALDNSKLMCYNMFSI